MRKPSFFAALTAAIFLLIMPLTAAAATTDEFPEWEEIDTTHSNTVVYARTEDLLRGRADQTDARVWVRMDHTRDMTFKARSSMMLYTVNCPAQTYRNLKLVMFSPNGESREGGVSGVTEYIVPKTIMAYVANLLCSG